MPGQNYILTQYLQGIHDAARFEVRSKMMQITETLYSNRIEFHTPQFFVQDDGCNNVQVQQER